MDPDDRYSLPKTPPPAVERSLSVPAAADTPYFPRRARANPPTDAVIVVHGMGQQTKLETLTTVTRGLVRAAGPLLDGRPRVRLVDLGADRYQRVELTLRSEAGQRELHVYEAYWAPLTEGAVTLRDVIYLMFTAVWNGVRNGTYIFRRWLFDRYEEFVPPIRGAVYLLVALLVVLALIVLNAAIAVVAAARWALGTRPPGLGDGLYGDLSTVFDGLIVTMIAFGFALWLGRAGRGRARPVRFVLGIIGVVLFWAALLATVLAGVAVPLLFHLHWQEAPPEDSPLLPVPFGAVGVDWFNGRMELLILGLLLVAAVLVGLEFVVRVARALVREVRGPSSRNAKIASLVVLLILLLFVGFIVGVLALALRDWQEVARDTMPAVGRNAVWLLLVVASAVVRRTLIQYLGDVAAYVQSHTLDRFDALRERIKETVWRQAHAIYGATRSSGLCEFEYDSVAVVGHSLGSVIAYDTLNRLINDDVIAQSRWVTDGQKSPPPLDASRRTCLLLTFGSPLDKTAFVFASQGPESETRLALAATAQPLIDRPEYRRFPWINVYSKWDPISGPLHYYDPSVKLDADRAPDPVRNLADGAAMTFLLAHVEYWDGDLIYRTILDNLPFPPVRAWRGKELTSCPHGWRPAAHGSTGLLGVRQHREE